MKTRYVLTALTALTLTTQLQAANTPTLETRVQALEEKDKERNKVLPEIKASNVFFADASYLFWRAYEDGLEFATAIMNPGDTGVATSQNLDFEWNSGFRVGVGYRMPHDFWELDVTWTRLHSRASGLVTNNLPEDVRQIQTIWNGAATGGHIVSIQSNLKIHLNVIDGEIARYIPLTRHLAIKPHFGIRGLLVSQNYSFDKTGTNIDSSLIHSLNHYSSRCRAVGLRAAFDGEWHLWQGLSLYGNVGGALLTAAFDLYEDQANASSATFNFGYDRIHATLLPTLDLALGIDYQHSFSGKAALGIRAGWEFNDFFNQNKITGFAFGNSDGAAYSNDLTYQGLTVNIRLDF